MYMYLYLYICICVCIYVCVCGNFGHPIQPIPPIPNEKVSFECDVKLLDSFTQPQQKNHETSQQPNVSWRTYGEKPMENQLTSCLVAAQSTEATNLQEGIGGEPHLGRLHCSALHYTTLQYIV